MYTPLAAVVGVFCCMRNELKDLIQYRRDKFIKNNEDLYSIEYYSAYLQRTFPHWELTLDEIEDIPCITMTNKEGVSVGFTLLLPNIPLYRHINDLVDRIKSIDMAYKPKRKRK